MFKGSYVWFFVILSITWHMECLKIKIFNAVETIVEQFYFCNLCVLWVKLSFDSNLITLKCCTIRWKPQKYFITRKYIHEKID